MRATRQANRKRSPGEKPRRRKEGEEEGGISEKKQKNKKDGKRLEVGVGRSSDLGCYLSIWSSELIQE